MASLRLRTARLELRPLPAAAASALPGGRAEAARLLAAELAPEWPLAELLDALPHQAAAAPADEPFGVWVVIERESGLVVGDAGFLGPPGADGAVELGYGVVPARRGRGYAAEAAGALVEWALAQRGVEAVVAGCAPGNAPSVRTLERVGFVRTGERGGELRWLLVRRVRQLRLA